MTRMIAAVLLLCLVAASRADVALLNPPRGECRVECREAVRTGCLFAHPGLRRSAIRRCHQVCLHGGDRSTICTLRTFPPPLGNPFGN